MDSPGEGDGGHLGADVPYLPLHCTALYSPVQGHTNLMYPWGDSPDPALVPAFSSGRAMPPPDDVDAHPGGASWCGAEDLVGNVYTWTRSRFMIYFLCI